VTAIAAVCGRIVLLWNGALSAHEFKLVLKGGNVIDCATFQDWFQPSEGFAHVLAGGAFVVCAGAFQEGVHPGPRLLR